MAYVVTKFCDNCKYTDCVDVCPVEAFHEGPTMVYINPDTCIDCGACVDECPVEAIYEDEEIPDKWKNYIEINAEMSEKYPVITEKKDAMPSAKTLEELKAEEEG